MVSSKVLHFTKMYEAKSLFLGFSVSTAILSKEMWYCYKKLLELPWQHMRIPAFKSLEKKVESANENEGLESPTNQSQSWYHISVSWIVVFTHSYKLSILRMSSCSLLNVIYMIYSTQYNTHIHLQIFNIPAQPVKHNIQ